MRIKYDPPQENPVYKKEEFAEKKLSRGDFGSERQSCPHPADFVALRNAGGTSTLNASRTSLLRMVYIVVTANGFAHGHAP